MNIEQKAKAYDEAIDKITDAVEAGTIEKGLAEWLFPELKESKDEKIKKAIYNVLKYLERDCSWDSLGKVDILDAYDWLEKQKKSTWDEKDEHRVKDTIYFLETAKKHYASTIEIEACIDWLKTIKKRMGG